MMLLKLLIIAAACAITDSHDVKDIEKQIQDSKQEILRHEALAQKYADRAQRMQQQGKSSDTRTLYELEEREKEIAKYLQKEIDALEQCKIDLQK